MQRFTNIVARLLRRLPGAPAQTVSTVESERFVETGAREIEMTLAQHGIEGHEWEEFEQ
jgi:deoxyribose-phosphate aldolase